MNHADHPISQAAHHVGSQAALARLLGVKPPTVNQWVLGRRPVPNEQGVAIERVTGGKVTADQVLQGLTWVRVPDADWPHPLGRPLLDVAAGSKAEPEVQGA